MAKALRNLQFAILIILYYSGTFISISNAKNITHSKLHPKHQTGRTLPIRAVNLGGWLVAEGWITPSLFEGIPNKDLIDGTRLVFHSATVGKYLTAESGGGKNIVANRSSASEWEIFTLWRLRENVFYLRVLNQQFMGVNSDGVVVATENTPSSFQQFLIERKPDEPTRVRIMAPNGFYIQVKNEGLITADSNGGSGWGDNDPSVFTMRVSPIVQGDFVATMHGEFQLVNGYGPVKAEQVMREHWDTFIVENDFKFIAKNGLDGVRIPVGYWIASDPSPPEPYVSGSLEYLDKAFMWARKYGLKVVLDLHAAPGAQNTWGHSGSRDGSQSWGETDETIQQTLAVIEFLTARYVKNPSLYAIEVLNEPYYPIVHLDTLKKYYKAAYDIIRKHSKTVYVMMNNRIGLRGISTATELISFASKLDRTVLDVHYYASAYPASTVEANINIILKSVIATQLNELIDLTSANGPLIFVGEWDNEWFVKNATKEEYKMFCDVQREIYNTATFGWSYFTYKGVEEMWSLQWMIKNGYFKLK